MRKQKLLCIYAPYQIEPCYTKPYQNMSFDNKHWGFSQDMNTKVVRNRASYNNPIFPFLGMKTVNQFPLVGFFFWINSQKWEQKFQPIPNVGKRNSINSQSQMGKKISTNSQWGEIKFNQLPVLLECQRKRLIQIFQSIPSSVNSCGNQFPLWE